jgi:hypothetical protein
MSRRKTRNFVWAITLLFFSLGMFIYWFILDLWSLIFSQKATQFIPTGTLSMHHLFVLVCPLIFARIGRNVLIFTLQFFDFILLDWPPKWKTVCKKFFFWMPLIESVASNEINFYSRPNEFMSTN